MIAQSRTAPEGPFASNALVAGARFGNYLPPCPVYAPWVPRRLQAGRVNAGRPDESLPLRRLVDGYLRRPHHVFGHQSIAGRHSERWE
jgi:hypothetical protein